MTKIDETTYKRLSTQELKKLIEVAQNYYDLDESGRIDFNRLSDVDKALVREYIGRTARKAQRRIDRKKGRIVHRELLNFKEPKTV